MLHSVVNAYLTGGGGGGGSPAAITVGAHADNSLAANYPASIALGDFLLAAVSANTAPTINYTGPAGWERLTQVVYDNASGNAVTSALFYKVADGTETGTATFTATGTVNAHTATIARVTGVTGFEGLTALIKEDTSTGTFASPALTTTGTGRTLLTFYSGPTPVTLTESAGWTEAFDYAHNGAGSSDYNTALHYAPSSGTGVQATETPTPSSATRYVMISLALTPSGSPPSASISVRGTRLTHVNNASSLAFSFPTGSVAGDRCVLCVSHGFAASAAPTGWHQLDAKSGSQFNGSVYEKVLSAADIATGTVTVNFAGVFYGHVAGVTFVGCTGGIRTTESTRNNPGATSRTVTTAATTPQTGDYAIYFGGTRSSTAVCTVGSGSSLQSATNTNAAACLYGGALGSSGAVAATFAYSVAGLGDYQAIVVVMPARQ